jgi:uncharacterized membrane protein
MSAAAGVLPLALDAYLTDWLNLLLRSLHVVAAIAWIGASFYFVHLDQLLRPPKKTEDAATGVGGEAWELHGGGFYHVQKYAVAPERLPEQLAWFKWEAYTTWLSGFGLLVVLYYLNASTYLIDPSVADLSPWQASALSVALLIVGWIAYDVLCRTVSSELLLGTAIVLLTGLAAWGASQLFSDRAAWLQVGAMLGTVMAGNVLFSIMPAQHELVRAKEAGREPDARPGRAAKRRSVHNNYLTLPVLATMLAGHFAFLTGRSYAWLILVFLMVVGATARLFFNLRHAGRTIWWIPAAGFVAIAVLAIALRPDDKAATNGAEATFADVQPVIAARCASCHSMEPTQPGFTSAPAGVVLETQEEIEAQSDRIRTQVKSDAMPLGNVTKMTDEERDLVVAWVSQGAQIE